MLGRLHTEEHPEEVNGPLEVRDVQRHVEVNLIGHRALPAEQVNQADQVVNSLNLGCCHFVMPPDAVARPTKRA